MEEQSSPGLESLLALWPVASSLSETLPVGDLITLSRLSATLRAVLHGFERPECTHNLGKSVAVRRELRVGQHATTYWQSLKNRAPFECSSPSHTKGSNPRPCRYCSRPICAACIVRSSFARGHENTFQNRIRYLCKGCWESGNISRSHRFELDSSVPGTKQTQWHDPNGSTKNYCTCTLKDDGWLCLDCKDLQNWEAISSGDTDCHGLQCGSKLDADKERRRICLWCDKALPRQIGGTTRHHWNQKMVEARARNAAARQADLEEYNRRRQKLLRMSRREMRGDEAVRDDPDADVPQFIRHLDTVNYRAYLNETAAPSGDSVYDSKRGYWRYNTEFLLKMRPRCQQVIRPPQLATLNQTDICGLRFARTNAEKSEDTFSFTAMAPSMSKDRVKEWCTLKAHILELLLVRKLSYAETCNVMYQDHDFDASLKEYRKVLHLWYSQGHFGRYRRGSSLDREDDHDSIVADSGGSPSSSLAAPEDTGLERIPTLDSDLSLDSATSAYIYRATSNEHRLFRTNTRSTTASVIEDPARYSSEPPLPPPRVSRRRDSKWSALKRKIQQDRHSLLRAGESSNAPDVVTTATTTATTTARARQHGQSRGDDGDDDDDEEESCSPDTSWACVPDDDLAPGLAESAHAVTRVGVGVGEQTEENPPPYSPNGWIWP
ncbi:hypothetical protein PV08_02629 [Exophiala spinifera]|uniref:Clr5 domain-containing protein n=1 Tax=Exophiala spinifera TaxID=91928 RepID=A0A0D1YST6_9EURO|nr:uncharacterized protein PV08_02629 [Exophiala spinifera]KIW18341.1 hypothetical protein PV08_02629 [Exophiala spinifera]